MSLVLLFSGTRRRRRSNIILTIIIIYFYYLTNKYAHTQQINDNYYENNNQKYENDDEYDDFLSNNDNRNNNNNNGDTNYLVINETIYINEDNIDDIVGGNLNTHTDYLSLNQTINYNELLVNRINKILSTQTDNQDVMLKIRLLVISLLKIMLVSCILGNILVILSVFTYRPLQNVQNIFIVSLAVADLCVSVIVLPFHIVFQVTNNHWIFDAITCQFFLTSDILLCTSSILHLCCIALDRYWAIKDSIKYAQKRTLKRVVCMIAISWISSAFISVPGIIWNTKSSGYFPKPLTQTQTTTVAPSSIFLASNNTNENFTENNHVLNNNATAATAIEYEFICDISKDIIYRFYSSFGTFFIPLFIMTFVYVRIYLETKKRLRERAKAAKKLANSLANSTKQDPQLGNSKKRNKCILLLCCNCNKKQTNNNNGGISASNNNNSKDINQKIINNNNNSNLNLNKSINNNNNNNNKTNDNDDGFNQTIDKQTNYNINDSAQKIGFLMDKNMSKSTTDAKLLLDDNVSRLNPTSSDDVIDEDDDVCNEDDEYKYELPTVKRNVRMSIASSEVSSIRKETFKSNRFKKNATAIVNSLSLSFTAARKSLHNNNKEFICRDSISSHNRHSSMQSIAANNSTNVNLNECAESEFEVNIELSGVKNDIDLKENQVLIKEQNTYLTTTATNTNPNNPQHNNNNTNNNTTKPWSHNTAHTNHTLQQRQKISLTRERRAARTLGIIMGGFIFCWCPFFLVYLAQAFGIEFNETLVIALTWLGFVNSAINPVIYTIFNLDFRKSFKRLLFGCKLCKRQN